MFTTSAITTKKQKRRKYLSTSAAIRRQKERSKLYRLRVVAQRDLVDKRNLRYNVSKLKDAGVGVDETQVSFHMCEMSKTKKMFVVVDTADGQSHLVRNFVYRHQSQPEVECLTRFYSIQSSIYEYKSKEQFLLIPFDPFTHLQQQFRGSDQTQVEFKYHMDIVHQMQYLFECEFIEVECSNSFINKHKHSLEIQNIDFNTIKLKVVEATGLFIGGYVMMGGAAGDTIGENDSVNSSGRSDSESDLESDGENDNDSADNDATEIEEQGEYLRIPYDCMLSITPM